MKQDECVISDLIAAGDGNKTNAIKIGDQLKLSARYAYHSLGMVTNFYNITARENGWKEAKWHKYHIWKNCTVIGIMNETYGKF